MVANRISPDEHCRDFIEKLQSSNLHYVVQETPFSLYVTVRKLKIAEIKFEFDNKYSEKATKHVAMACNTIESKLCSESSPNKQRSVKPFPPITPDSKLRNDINRNSLFPPFSSNIKVFGLHHSEEACDSMTAIEQDDGTNFGKNDSCPDPGGS